ncbi:MAG: hypothetical protein Unbinned1524contig1000_5 [Prokaryotic dsDNA virus sp.]|nr:MAG: hypothetical protein Unbinned1524contig1000_5 [Prokaryotic dsDNA virus sp.]|tara:strand:- start:5812 stop:6012 length:201 start_codon:yes stop_codon:yes gene_type:complete
MKKNKGYIYIGSKNHERLRDIYVMINDLLEYSVAVYGGDDDCGSRELGIRQEYDKMLENLKQVLKS